ncbi:hypothetical protein EYF80_024871 [Liparis tanakae]|uniref:Uncharacterized protein n=1 Tax=Liparis tanakae TaxID=230148 RepID=A0A4Z2HIW0_9TELE|nr:hypothetical protein EYF80_024871 [Liparis tanakae]
MDHSDTLWQQLVTQWRGGEGRGVGWTSAVAGASVSAAQRWPLLRPTLLVPRHGAGVRLLNCGVPECLARPLESTGNLCSQSEMQEDTEG